MSLCDPALSASVVGRFLGAAALSRVPAFRAWSLASAFSRASLERWRRRFRALPWTHGRATASWGPLPPVVGRGRDIGDASLSLSTIDELAAYRRHSVGHSVQAAQAPAWQARQACQILVPSIGPTGSKLAMPVNSWSMPIWFR